MLEAVADYADVVELGFALVVHIPVFRSRFDVEAAADAFAAFGSYGYGGHLRLGFDRLKEEETIFRAYPISDADGESIAAFHRLDCTLVEVDAVDVACDDARGVSNDQEVTAMLDRA